MAYWYFCDHAIWFCKLSNRKDRIEAVERRNVGFSASLAAKCSRPEKMVRHTIARLSPTGGHDFQLPKTAQAQHRRGAA